MDRKRILFVTAAYMNKSIFLFININNVKNNNYTLDYYIIKKCFFDTNVTIDKKLIINSNINFSNEYNL